MRIVDLFRTSGVRLDGIVLVAVECTRMERSVCNLVVADADAVRIPSVVNLGPDV